MAVLGICVAERCRVSWLVPHGVVNSSCWRWYSIVVRCGEPWVDRLGQAEAPGRGGCLACLRRCLPGYDGALRIGAIVAAQRCWLFLVGCDGGSFGWRTFGRNLHFPTGLLLVAWLVSLFHLSGFTGVCHLLSLPLRKGCDRRECEGSESLVVRCRIFRMGSNVAPCLAMQANAAAWSSGRNWAAFGIQPT